MGSVVNQNSFILIAAAVILVAALILLSRNPKWTDYLAFSVICLGLLTAWIIMHPRQTPLMEDAQKIQAMIGAGKPVLLEFQSPY